MQTHNDGQEKSKMDITLTSTGDMIVRKDNIVGLDGLEFLEFAAPDPDEMERLFFRLGFRLIARHRTKEIFLFRQGRTNFILNKEKNGFAQKFYEKHGPSICSTGFRVVNSKNAYETALKRGATACVDNKSQSFPSVHGIGGSVINFVDNFKTINDNYKDDFIFLENAPSTSGFGLDVIDHMTNNVPAGEMDAWCEFYSSIFNFDDVRFFNIKGDATGLLSKVMRSPCNKITIPINQPTNEKSQIQEYLDEYKGSGIQHVALLTNDMISTVRNLRKQGIEFLDVPDSYYDVLLERLPNVTEKLEDLKELSILVDGDESGYLLQIFTKNLIGPIFFEIIQRKNHNGFGEGNFQALFDSIERDQRQRGYLD